MAFNSGKSKKEVPRQVVFWTGGAAGMTSAMTTHFLDVGKVCKQVGHPTPASWFDRGWFRGLPAGAFAQGERFAVTLLLNETLQKRLKAFRAEREKSTGFATHLLSLTLSMFSAGVGEFMANPPVAIKNYQIAHNVPGIIPACRLLYAEKGIPAFFRGVLAGVFRKSLANAVVLQTIGPMKAVVGSVGHLDVDNNSSHAAFAGFASGGLTGGVAEVLTNPPDRVKTIMQARPHTPLWDACKEVAKQPFKGAGYAFVRKGAIRAINWGTVGTLIALYRSKFMEEEDDE